MNKIARFSLIGCLSVLLLIGAFAGGLFVGHLSSSGSFNLPFVNMPAVPGVGAPSGGATPAEYETLFAPFWEAWQLVHDQYVDQPVDDTKLMQGAIRGMLEALGDEHTSYMDPQQFKDANAGISGNYEGIGAYVDSTGDYLTIISPIKGSPAEGAGLRAGDKIVAIDGEDMTGIDPELVRQRVLGPAGSTVKLSILREGDEKPFEVEITRAQINIASVEYEMKGDIAYVKLNTFGETTTEELKTALKELMAQNPKGLILDLRNNGGGYLRTAIEVSSQFVKEGVIVTEKYGDGKEDKYSAEKGGLALDIPMVVLVNEGSASASEIVAGALQDYARAQLVGVTTYGKGSVQIWTPLANEQGAVRVTIAKWLTPTGRTIHKVGLTPDVVVEMTQEDFDAQRDPQLDKAIELLSK